MTSTSSTSGRSRGLVLAVLCAMQLMIILDGTIVSVALPAIKADLGFADAGLAWVVNAYLLSFAGLLLLSGRLSDLIGSRRIFLGGLAVFTAASLLCAVATSPVELIAGRFAQGIGGALASAVILGMIVRMYPKPGEQAAAIGIYSFTSASGGSIGLIGGGVITEALGWHWAFAINVPIGVVALIAAARLISPDRGIGLRGGADIAGSVLVTAGLALGVFTIVRTADVGWGSAQTLALAAATVVLLTGFVFRQATARTPMLPLRIFRRRQITGANIAAVFIFAAGFGFQFLTALFLQRVLGYDPLHTGLAFVPVPIMIGLVSLFLSAKVSTRFGPRTVLIGGLAVFVVTLALLSTTPTDSGYLRLLPILTLMGAGMGFAIPAIMSLAMSAAPAPDAGLASGLINTTQQAGGAIGLAVLASLAASRTDALASTGVNPTSALRDGYGLGYLIATGLVIVAIIVVITVIRPARAAARSADDAPNESAVAVTVG